MNQKEIQARIDELNKQCVEIGATASRAGMTHTATMTLYNVAVGAKDKKAQDDHRLTLHTMLDVILDNGAALCIINEELSDLCLQVLSGKH